MSSHVIGIDTDLNKILFKTIVIGIDTDVYSAFAVIFNILCLEVAYDSMRLFYWYLHYIYDLILYLCIMYYTVFLILLVSFMQS